VRIASRKDINRCNSKSELKNFFVKSNDNRGKQNQSASSIDDGKETLKMLRQALSQVAQEEDKEVASGRRLTSM